LDESKHGGAYPPANMADLQSLKSLYEQCAQQAAIADAAFVSISDDAVEVVATTTQKAVGLKSKLTYQQTIIVGAHCTASKPIRFENAIISASYCSSRHTLKASVYKLTNDKVTTYHLELIDHANVITCLDLSSHHDAVYSSDIFFSGMTWSVDGDHLVYVAERSAAKTASW
jgi:hypothetical protein